MGIVVKFRFSTKRRDDMIPLNFIRSCIKRHMTVHVPYVMRKSNCIRSTMVTKQTQHHKDTYKKAARERLGKTRLVLYEMCGISNLRKSNPGL